MKHITINENISSIFNSFKAEDLAKKIIGNLSESALNRGESVETLIMRELDESMIYDEDKWMVIANYSAPENPCGYSEAEGFFIGDIARCVDVWED